MIADIGSLIGNWIPQSIADLGCADAHAEGADSWTAYQALTTPTAQLADRSPVEIVTAGTILDVGDMVCELLMSR